MVALPFAAQSQDWQDIAQRPQGVLGSLSCASVTCHGRVEPRNFPGAASQQEYLHWLGGQPSYVGGLRHYDPRARVAKDYADPHALAARRMAEPRFQEVLRRASNLPDGQTDPQIYAKCAACHDPLSLVPASPLTLTPALSHREREPDGARSTREPEVYRRKLKVRVR